MLRYISIALLLLTCGESFAQADSILDQGVYRHYIVHLPAGYSAANDYPVILNFHGLGSNAQEQQLYSNMNAAADAEGFIVVYPDGIDNQWNLGQNQGPDDVQFALALLDQIRADYSTNDCWFSTGMSMGGFLTYKIACTPTNAHDLPTAIAVVTGNMLTLLQQTSSNLEAVPVMHFHGTNDGTVPYNGSTGVSPVENTAAWWANENNCSSGPVTEALPNTSTTDNSAVDRISYSGGDESAQVILYRVNGGGHTWPGAPDVPQLGVTNHDIDATELIVDFFASYCGTAGIGEKVTGSLEVFPNPSNGTFAIKLPQEAIQTLTLTDLSGRTLQSWDAPEQTVISANAHAAGTYTVTAVAAGGKVFRSTVILAP